MFLPYAANNTTDAPPTRRPIATLVLLGINVALMGIVAIGQWGGRWSAQPLFMHVGIVPASFHTVTLLTYMFFHAGFAHLLLNMFYLWVFGAGVEEAVGSWRFLLLYMASGAFGGALQALVTYKLLADAGGLPIVGASAACAGLIGLYSVRYYRARLSFVFVPFNPHVVSVVTVFLIYEIGSGLFSLAAGFAEGGIAHWAHIGGFIFGLSCAQGMGLAEAGQRYYMRQDAVRAMKRSVPGAAIERCEALLAHEPENAGARVELARAWLMLGDREQATNQYVAAITSQLSQNQRMEAANLWAEMRKHGLKIATLSSMQIFAIALTLEESEQFVLAAEAMHRVAMENSDASEAPTALLKVISLYVHRLNRLEEARELLRLFGERYPDSPWRNLADSLTRAALGAKTQGKPDPGN